MSVTVMARVFWTPFDKIQYQDKNGKIVKVGKPAAKIVMLAIADSADDFGENSWQSFDTISQKSGIERRSVIRVIRGLMAFGYLSINGVSKYGTNDYKISLSKLGNIPEKRAKVGRPSISDSDTEIGDSVAITGDSSAKTGDIESPESSFTHPKDTHKRGDLVDGFLAFSIGPGVKMALLKTDIESAIKVKLSMNPSGKDAESFITYAAKEHKAGREFPKFLEWWLVNGGDRRYWSFKRMEQMYPMAFQAVNVTSSMEVEW